MNRLVACAVVAALGNASAAFAGESLLTSGTRQVQQIAAAPGAPAASATVKAVPLTTLGAQAPTASYQAEPGGPGNLSKSGHSKATKVMIYSALGAGFALSAWAIDHHVLNLTPSTLGQRKD
jgi:hypothetical protein